MSTEHNHIKDVYSELVHGWPIISGVILTSWYAIVRFKRSLFKNFVTHQDLDRKIAHNTNVIIQRIDSIDERSAERHDHLKDLFISHLDKNAHQK